jgi:hypothetical protein
MEKIIECAQRICNAVASAIEVYSAVSGADHDDLPESFIQSYVFVELSHVLTMTLETNYSKLWEWNAHSIWRKTKPSPVFTLPKPPPEFKEKSGRSDMIIFQGDHHSKNDMDFLAIVEYKRNWLSQQDIDKIRCVLPKLDTMPHGIVCGFVRENDFHYIDNFKTSAESSGDIFVRGRTSRPLGINNTYCAFAQIINNPAYIGDTQQ